MSGVYVWHGVPGCGKSTAMRAMAHSVSNTTGQPIIAVDPARVPTWADLERAKDLHAVIHRTWANHSEGGGQHSAYEPTAEDLDRLCDAARAGREVILAVDELRPYASQYSAGTGLVILARQHRHADVTLLLGTQSIGDVRTDLLSAATEVYTGKCSSPRILEYLRREYGLDPDRVMNLKRGEWITTKMGF